MNPYRIYRDEWATALITQTTSKEYKTFVAMPFEEKFSYHSKDIYESIICASAAEATKQKGSLRSFAKPQRVDQPKGAVVITEVIINLILESHFFIADLTSQNAGVILETGVALATKPNRQVILITQGALSDLHFDLRNNNVISYNPSNSVSNIATAFIDAAKAFEEQVQQHILSITRQLSPEAILVLKRYGQIQKENPGNSLHAHENVRGASFPGQEGINRFEAATRELLNKGLLRTDYAVESQPGFDSYGMHATEFGWAAIENMWVDLRRS